MDDEGDGRVSGGRRRPRSRDSSDIGPPGRPPLWPQPEIVAVGRTLEHLVGSRIRARLLALLLLEPGRVLWLREICREVRGGVSSIQRELKWLTLIDLVREDRRGGAHFFKVNEEHPLCEPLREVIAGAASVDSSRYGMWREPPKDFPLRYR